MSGQLMGYFEYPTAYNWQAMPYNEGNETISNFLLELANMSGAKFTVDGTTASVADLKKTMTNLGYKVSDTKQYKSGQTFPALAIITANLNIKDGYKDTYYGGDHSRLAGGGGYTESWEQTEYYSFRSRLTMDTFDSSDYENYFYDSFAYMIWGWMDYRLNGFYSQRNFACPVATMSGITYFTAEPNK